MDARTDIVSFRVTLNKRRVRLCIVGTACRSLRWPPRLGLIDPSHISPEMNNSPQQTGSGRATPRTAANYSGYSTPQRGAQLPSSNLYNVMSNDARAGAPNGAEQYPQQAYAVQQYTAMNGAPGSNKRGRESDDEPYANGIKRSRTEGAPGGARPIAQPHSIKSGR